MSATDIIAEIQRWPEDERERLFRLLLADQAFRKAVESKAETKLAENGARKSLAKLAGLAASFPSNPLTPSDAAAQHDHYLYGAPKTS